MENAVFLLWYLKLSGEKPLVNDSNTEHSLPPTQNLLNCLIALWSLSVFIGFKISRQVESGNMFNYEIAPPYVADIMAGPLLSNGCFGKLLTVAVSFSWLMRYCVLHHV